MTRTAAVRKESDRALDAKRESRQEAWTRSKWGPDGQQVPSDQVDLRAESSDTKRAFFMNLMIRAEAEREGEAPGNTATIAAAAPATQRVLAEEARRGSG